MGQGTSSREAWESKKFSGCRFWRGLLLAGIIGLASGCSVFKSGKDPRSVMAPVKIEETSGPGRKEDAITLSELQSINMSFTDGFVIALGQACTELEEDFPQAKERGFLLQWRLSHCNVLIILASGQNPAVALLDLIGTTTMSRMILEEYWIPNLLGEKGRILLDVHRKQEETIWNLAARVLTSEQQTKLRALIETWHDEHPGQRFVSFISISDYVQARGVGSTMSKSKTSNILSVLRLNPLSDLDPAARAIDETRHFAQRSMYYMQRMPTLLRWQTEVLVHDLANSEEGRKVLDNLTAFRETGDHFLQIAEALPGRLAQAQTQVLTNLNRQSEQLQSLVVEFKAALNAGEAMAMAVDKALTTLDAYTGRFDGSKGATNEAPRPPSRPFDVLEYAQAAQDIGAAAKELTEAVHALDQLANSEAWRKRTSDIDALIGQAQTGSEQLLDKAVYRMALLIGGTLVGVLLALLTYRFILLKWMKHAPK